MTIKEPLREGDVFSVEWQGQVAPGDGVAFNAETLARIGQMRTSEALTVLLAMAAQAAQAAVAVGKLMLADASEPTNDTEKKASLYVAEALDAAAEYREAFDRLEAFGNAISVGRRN